ncbi:long-chain fatty acid--CoA ligase [Streptomyces sp. RLB1-33]|nr:long-chain fatty acid--CoA ligase [Streptomyces sp. RLB1-33]QIY76096.1 long-chain fatty acid--CoA ligase [Streptomyces sp. RLB1-33]
MTNLAAFLVDSAAAQGDCIAVRHDDSTLTYAELDDTSARVAALLLDRGLRPGDRVALTMPNVPLFPVVYYGILRAGGVVVPMNPLLKAREVAFTLRDCGAQIALVFPLFADQVAKAAAETGTECLVTEPLAFDDMLRARAPMLGIVDRGDDDPALILYTSGTTGTPKGAELSHRNLATNTATATETLLQVEPDDVLFGGLPLFHAFGQTCALNTAVAAGATLTLLPRFEPQRALEIMARDGVTVFLGVPTMYAALLHAELAEGFDAGRLRLAVSGGAALPVEVLHGFERRFGATVLEGYGLSETSPVAAFNHPDRPRKAGSIGLPIRGVEMRLVAEGGAAVPPGEVGEIAIRGENVMTGYWNRPEATAEAIRDGWFHSGDLARVDDDGFYFIVDRKKDLIIRGGYNVYPREVEEVLYEHPAVAEAAVVGVPHPVHGEEIAAVITVRPGAHVTAQEIREHVKDRLAAYKYPRIVSFTAELPKGPTGKILKREIMVTDL